MRSSAASFDSAITGFTSSYRANFQNNKSVITPRPTKTTINKSICLRMAKITPARNATARLAQKSRFQLALNLKPEPQCRHTVFRGLSVTRISPSDLAMRPQPGHFMSEPSSRRPSRAISSRIIPFTAIPHKDLGRTCRCRSRRIVRSMSRPAD